MADTASTTTCDLLIDGMHCDACELFLEQTAKKQQGVQSVHADSTSQKVRLTLDKDTNVEEVVSRINDQISKQGYRVVESLPTQERSKKVFALSAILAFSIVAVFLLLQKLNITSLIATESLSYPTIFLLGVVASLSTCMAVVGGVAMTLSSKFASEHRSKAILVFHIARFIGFVVLGGIIGLLGRVVVINATMSAALRLVVAVVMGAIGLDMLGVKFRKLTFPKRISEVFGIFDDKDGWTSAVLLGVATFFLPCAFTQSMQLYTVTTGSFIKGMLVMGTFALGTLPVLALVSFGSASSVQRVNKGLFGYTMGFLIFLFSLLNVISALVSLGIFPSFWWNLL